LKKSEFNRIDLPFVPRPFDKLRARDISPPQLYRGNRDVKSRGDHVALREAEVRTVPFLVI